MKLKIRKVQEKSKVFLPSLKGDETVYFEIQPMTRRKDLKIRDNLLIANKEMTELRFAQNQVQFARVAASIVDWKGLEDEDGKAIAFRGSPEQIEGILDCLEEEDYQALVNAIGDGDDEDEDVKDGEKEEAKEEAKDAAEE